ncbi:hypothetical protein [Nocardia sp. NPDC051981]|uniref:hypothetical protein n=1 Tax=Nocardia sp. NPDC051981 TaxID=3155417 RepID=UPI0034202C8C
MRTNIFRTVLFVALATAGVMLTSGTASAVTPAQCEKESNGKVVGHLDPNDSSKAICTCKGGFYDGQEVYGATIIYVGQYPYPVTCVGLEVGA